MSLPDKNVYKDSSFVWDDSNKAWMTPVHGKNYLCRVISTIDHPATAYIFCRQHGWLTSDRNGHSSNECFEYFTLIKANTKFVSANIF